MCKQIQSMNKGFYLQGAIDRERKESVAEWTYLMEQRQEWPLALRWVRLRGWQQVRVQEWQWVRAWGWPLGWVQE